jgi:hypothetical protein
MVHFYQGYHPFYITDDPEGGYEFKTAQERKKVKVFAGTKAAWFLPLCVVWLFPSLKGLSHEIDFKHFDKNLQNLT